MHIPETESRLSEQLLSNFQAISCEIKIKAEVKNGVA